MLLPIVTSTPPASGSATMATRPGPILTRHPGEVFLATGRQALEVSTSERAGEPDDQSDAIERTIDRYGVAYLLLDADRYLHAVPSPLSRFVVERPARVRLVFPTRDSDRSGVAIFEVVPRRDGSVAAQRHGLMRRFSVAGPSKRSVP